MTESYYTISQVAKRLQLHVKTVRRYVHEGRLQATRIGKQYRISAEDLNAFSGTDVDMEMTQAKVKVPQHRVVDASTVVEVSAISPDSASRLSNTLLAAMKGRDRQPSARVDTIYYEETGRLKLILNGNLPFTAEMLKMIDMMLVHLDAAN